MCHQTNENTQSSTQNSKATTNRERNPNYVPQPELWPHRKDWCTMHRIYGKQSRKCFSPCSFDMKIDPQDPPKVPEGYNLQKLRWKNPLLNGFFKTEYNTDDAT